MEFRKFQTCVVLYEEFFLESFRRKL